MAVSFIHRVFPSLKKNKKGFLYLFLGITFLTLFAFLFLTYNEHAFQDKQTVVTTRIRSMDDFIVDLHSDLDRAAFISGYHAMLAVESYAVDNGFFANQSAMELAFAEAFMNGTIDGASFPVMENSSFSEYLSRVEYQASLIGLTLHLTLTNVSIKQATPWALHVLFTSAVRLDDLSGIASWSFTANFETNVPIMGLIDPLYSVNTNGDVPATINNFTLPPEGFVDASNNTEQLKLVSQGYFFRESNSSPIFLQRFTNDLSPSDLGIESLVDLPTINTLHGSVLKDRSIVDYIYFSSSPNTTTDRCQIQNMNLPPDDWFRLDAAHMDDYELDAMTSVPCP